MRSGLWPLLVCAWLAACAGLGPAWARPFTVEDLLRTESFGQAVIDPAGRWVVYEQRDPYVTGRRFDYNTRASWGLSRLYRVGLVGSDAGVARPALAEDPGPGVLLGAVSPGGRWLTVTRLDGATWRLGVLEVDTGAVRWLDVTPQEDGPGRVLQWLSEDAFVVIARGDGLAPLTVRRGFILAERLPRLWAAAANGEAAASVLGSGRYLDRRQRAPPATLLRVTAATGATTALAEGAFTDLELSPDGRRLALLSTGEDLQPDPLGPVRGPRGLETEATHLSVLDLASGTMSRPCPGCDVLPQLLSWSPSGRRLLVLARGADGLWTSGRLQRIEAAGEGRKTLGGDLALALDLNPAAAATAWMGETPLVLGRAPGAARDDWWALGDGAPVNLTARLPAAPDRRLARADAARLTVAAGGRLWRVSGAGRVTALAAGPLRAATPPPSGDGARLDRLSSEALSVRTGDGEGGRLAELSGAGLGWAGPVLGERRLLAYRGGVAAAVAVDAAGVERLELLVAGRPPTPIATINAGLAEIDVASVHAVRHRDVDGRPVVSWLFLPAGGQGRAPLLVRPYLGVGYAAAPRDPTGDAGFPLNLRLLTAHGYAVLVPSLPRSPATLAEPSDRLAERILAAVDAAAADPALAARIDAERLALVGYSFGGYTVMTAITQTGRFRAAVSLSGISDLTALWGGQSPFSTVEPEGGYTPSWRAGGVESTQTRLGAPPWAVPERYRRNSPLYAADRVTTPLMLAHGALDQIPVAQSEAMYAALFRQAKDALLVTYPGELHTLTSPSDIRDFYGRMFAFVDEHLSATPERVDAAGGP